MMSVIFFLICMVNNVLFNMKDALVITAKGSGAEIIPFIQVWMLFPLTFAATLWFTYLLRKRGLVKVTQTLLLAFFAFFAIFACVLYPLREQLELSILSETISPYLPAGCNGLVSMLRHWVLSLFFVISEMWACMVTAVLFWSIANEITPIEEAQQSYSWVRVGGAFGTTLGGQVPLLTNFLVPGVTVYGLMLIVSLSCLLIYALQSILVNKLIDRPICVQVCSKKNPGGVLLQLRQLFRSRYLMGLAVMVIGYNLVMNLFEVVWKAELKTLCPDFNQYNAALGNTSTLCGILTVILAFSTPRLITRLGWTKTALISPIFQLISSVIFFGLMFCRDMFSFELSSVLMMIVVTGGIQFSAGRASKYSLFDVCKDIAFIPLESQTKAQGKAAVDGLGSRMGRSAAALLHQGLFLAFASIGGGVPILAGVMVAVIICWVAATKTVGFEVENPMVDVSESLAA